MRAEFKVLHLVFRPKRIGRIELEWSIFFCSLARPSDAVDKMNRSNHETECWLCQFKGLPDEDGNCRQCRRPLVSVDKDPDEELQFYCVLCEERFVSRRDRSGFDQAACPNCGDLSNTPDFHLDEGARKKEKRPREWQVVMAIMVATFLGTTLLLGLFRWLAKGW